MLRDGQVGNVLGFLDVVDVLTGASHPLRSLPSLSRLSQPLSPSPCPAFNPTGGSTCGVPLVSALTSALLFRVPAVHQRAVADRFGMRLLANHHIERLATVVQVLCDRSPPAVPVLDPPRLAGL
jgi:hypothetical protein